MENNNSWWMHIHQTGIYPDTFSQPLINAWTRAQEMSIPYNIKELPQYQQCTFQELKQSSMRLYAYTNRCIGLVINQNYDDYMAVALFNKEGILLKCYGSSRALEMMKSEGIQRLSDWNADCIGPNAVNIGLKGNESTVTSGVENYALPLMNKTIYFSPCRLEHKDGGESVVLGGIAIIVPMERAGREYLLVVNSMAYDINLHFFMANTVEQFFANDERGVLNIDENIRTGKKYILYCDRNLFRVLGIPYSNICFKSLNELIDPLPDNSQFWNILDTRMCVNDFLINLTVQGRTESFRITTDPYNQSLLNIRGIRIYFSSMKFLAAKISKNVGNNALFTFNDLIGQTSSFQLSVLQGKRYAQSDNNILIMGEFGTGKTVFAQAIHNASTRHDGPFITVDCQSLPRDQVFRQLFGYEEEGVQDVLNIGYFELANNGTLFLKGVDTLSLEIQIVLLHAIVNKCFIREGGHIPIMVNVRVISSANSDLQRSIKERRFNPDLYYYLSALLLYLPPLKARRQDILLLADYFIKRLCKKSNKEVKRLSPEAKRLLQKNPWTGNVRELQNMIETLALLSDSQFIECEDIYQHVNDPKLLNDILEYKSFGKVKISQMELQRTLLSCHNNKKQASEKLGISRRSLYRYLEKYAQQGQGTPEDE